MRIRPMVKLVIHDDQVVIAIPDAHDFRAMAVAQRPRMKRRARPATQPPAEPVAASGP